MNIEGNFNRSVWQPCSVYRLTGQGPFVVRQVVLGVLTSAPFQVETLQQKHWKQFKVCLILLTKSEWPSKRFSSLPKCPNLKRIRGWVVEKKTFARKHVGDDNKCWKVQGAQLLTSFYFLEEF